MNKFASKLNKIKNSVISKAKKRRNGFSLLDVMGGIAISLLLGGGVAAAISVGRDSANSHNTTQDIDVFSNAIQQMFISHPEVMKFQNGKPNAPIEKIVGYINDQLDDSFDFEVLSGVTNSGAVAATTKVRDAWDNPYGLYIYMDDIAAGSTTSTNYLGADGAPLKATDSCIYIVVASAGKSGTGVATGFDGTNIDFDTKGALTAGAMLNHTDGQDDMGVIVRMLNGDAYTATFGWDNATLGKLKGVQWIFGQGVGGTYYDFTGTLTSITSTSVVGGSIDKYYDKVAIGNDTSIDTTAGAIIGSWS